MFKGKGSSMREQRERGGGGGTDKVSFQRILGGISGRERSERKIVLKDEKLEWPYTIYILFIYLVRVGFSFDYK